MTRWREIERKYLLDVIRSLRYLARQGIPLQGLDTNDNLTQILLLLGTKDENIIDRLQGKVGHKYTHHDVQNELLHIMASNVLRTKVSTIRERKFISIMADEGADVSNVEQLSFCMRSVDNDLNVSEDFMGFYEIDNVKSEAIVHAIKDILLRCHLNLDDCRCQTLDGASNMMGIRSGVSTRILEEQPKANATPCPGHSLSLAIKSRTKDCTILRDTMATVGEICVLVKYSPKREKMLGSIIENIEGEFEESSIQKLDKLCVTRWTVRAKCFKKILDNYEALLQLWEQCLEERLDFETKSRIWGCQSQMKLFKSYFGLNLSHRLYSITDNLSKTLRHEKMSAYRRKEIADLTVQTLENMRNERDFGLLYEKIKVSAGSVGRQNRGDITTNAPKKAKKNQLIPYYFTSLGTQRQQHQPIIQKMCTIIINRFITKPLIPSLTPSKIDLINRHLDCLLKQKFLKAVEKQDVTEELTVLQTHFKDDFDAIP